MKKVVLLVVLSCLSASVFARNCPPSSEIFSRNGDGSYSVTAPAGWYEAEDRRTNHNDHDYIFRVSAWGDHNRSTDRVRCYYYDRADKDFGHVLLKSADIMDASHVSGWGGNDSRYYLCVSRSNNVGECSFV